MDTTSHFRVCIRFPCFNGICKYFHLYERTLVELVTLVKTKVPHLVVSEESILNSERELDSFQDYTQSLQRLKNEFGIVFVVLHGDKQKRLLLSDADVKTHVTPTSVIEIFITTSLFWKEQPKTDVMLTTSSDQLPLSCTRMITQSVSPEMILSPWSPTHPLLHIYSITHFCRISLLQHVTNNSKKQVAAYNNLCKNGANKVL